MLGSYLAHVIALTCTISCTNPRLLMKYYLTANRDMNNVTLNCDDQNELRDALHEVLGLRISFRRRISGLLIPVPDCQPRRQRPLPDP
jgi:hypothetical protein